MSSIIEDFSYDIFISYRQNDNKYDGWVTEFVDNLNRELEATIKDKVSVYIDINPQDGLLETYSVDRSLEEKLKCLIFIPVISQTYCDSKSFAWQREFCAFNKLAKEDKFGRDIRLSSGNVASRILPIKIHDLDPEDKTLLEDELGGVLRGIEFIYKEPGVNRPLRANEDHPDNNLNKTYYRNQINKVANTIKEIVTALKTQSQHPEKITKRDIEVKTAPNKNLITKVIAGTLMVLVLIVLGYFFIPKLLKPSTQLEKSIAVLPFRNDSPDTTNIYFINGLMEDILNNLQKIRDMRVISRTSVEQYRNQTRSIPEIAKELGVNYVVEGSGQRIGNTIYLRVQLLRAAKEDHLWGNSYEKEITNTKDIFVIQSQIAQSIASELNATITPQEKKIIEKVPTSDLAAYDAYLKGQFYWRSLKQSDLDIAMGYFELAKEKDPDYALAYAGISDVWIARQQVGFASPEEAGPKALEAAYKALELDSTRAEIHCTLALMKYSGMWDFEGSETEFKKAITINPNYAEARAYYSHLLNSTGRPEEAMQQINLAIKSDPLNPQVKGFYIGDLMCVHQYNEAIQICYDILKIDPVYPLALFNLAWSLHLTGKYNEALKPLKSFYFNTYKNVVHSSSLSNTKIGYFEAMGFEADTLAVQSKTTFIMPADIALFYIMAGNKEEALKWMEIAYDAHDPTLLYLQFPYFDSIRNEPRFQALCKKMNLPYK